MKSRRRRLKRNRLQRQKQLDANRTLSLVRIPPEDVDLCWPLIADYMDEGCQYGEIPADRLKTYCASGVMQLWVAWSDRAEGAGCTEILDAPEGKICLWTCMSCDDFARLRDEIAPQIEAWAKSMGCIGMRIWGRPGWERLMRRDHIKRWVAMDKRF